MDKNAGHLAIVMSAMNRSGFDFVGEPGGIKDGMVHLTNPLVIDYTNENGISRVAPLHLPVSAASVAANRTTVSIPLEAISYITEIAVDADVELCTMYRKFFESLSQEHPET